MENNLQRTPRIGQGDWPLASLQGMGSLEKKSLSLVFYFYLMVRLNLHTLHKDKGKSQAVGVMVVEKTCQSLHR